MTFENYDHMLSANLSLGIYHDTHVIVKPLVRPLRSDRETLEDLKTVSEIVLIAMC